LVDIVDSVVDVFDPIVVDKVESANCVSSKILPDVVERLETDTLRVEKFEPAMVDRDKTLPSM